MARRREFDEDQVIESAMHAFWAHGYRATSPAMLVDATGLSKSSLYATFGSKHGLFLLALDRYLDEQSLLMRAVLRREHLRDALTDMYQALIDLSTCGPQARCCLIASSSVEVPEVEASAVDRIATAMDGIVDAVRERIERAITDGELPADRDAESIARFVVNNNMGLQLTARSHPDPDVLWPIARQVVDAVCRP